MQTFLTIRYISTALQQGDVVDTDYKYASLYVVSVASIHLHGYVEDMAGLD